jgi:hypothetical protein
MASMHRVFVSIKRKLPEACVTLGIFITTLGILSFEAHKGCGYSKSRINPLLGSPVGCEGTVSYRYSDDTKLLAAGGTVLLAIGLLARKKKS